MKLTEGSYVSLGLVALVVSGAFALANWIGSLESKVLDNRSLIKTNQEEIRRMSEIRLQMDMRIFDQLNDIKIKIGKIEGYLDSKKESKNEKNR